MLPLRTLTTECVFLHQWTWVSDQGSHINNIIMYKLKENHNIYHHFFSAYSPWANGTVEILCLEVLHATRAILHERRLGKKDWPQVIHMVPSVLKEAPVKRLGFSTEGTLRTPLQVINGIRHNRIGKS